MRWNGRRVADAGVSSGAYFVPPRVAYTPQAPALLPGTLRENLLLGLPGDEATLAAASRQAVLEADLSLLPNRLETVIGAGGVRLSGGQIQRVAAARMFLREAELLVLLRSADQVIVLEEGRVTAIGTPRMVLLPFARRCGSTETTGTQPNVTS